MKGRRKRVAGIRPPHLHLMRRCYRVIFSCYRVSFFTNIFGLFSWLLLLSSLLLLLLLLLLLSFGIFLRWEGGGGAELDWPRPPPGPNPLMLITRLTNHIWRQVATRSNRNPIKSNPLRSHRSVFLTRLTNHIWRFLGASLRFLWRVRFYFVCLLLLLLLFFFGSFMVLCRQKRRAPLHSRPLNRKPKGERRRTTGATTTTTEKRNETKAQRFFFPFFDIRSFVNGSLRA